MTDWDDREVRGGVSLAEVVGRNTRRLRGNATADQLAKECRFYGLNWGTGRISDLEHGRVSPTLGTLVALALALGEVRFVDPEGPRDPISLTDLVRCDENIALTKSLSVTEQELGAFLDGSDVSLGHRYADLIRASFKAVTSGEYRKDWPARLPRFNPMKLADIKAGFGEAEQRLARDLGIDETRLAAEMLALWRRPFAEERDSRAGPDSNAQKKGRITRDLKAELKAVLDGDDQ